MLEDDGSPEHRALAEPGAARSSPSTASTLRDGGDPRRRRADGARAARHRAAGRDDRPLADRRRRVAPWRRTTADALYGLPLDAFVPERDALAKRLRAEARRDEADEIKALRKPSVAAWAVNQAVRSQPKAARALWEAGDALIAAQDDLLAGKGDAAGLRPRPRASATRSTRCSTRSAAC